MKTTRTLIRWGLVSVNGDGPYAAGMEDRMTTRATTRLEELDLHGGTALTRNGRPYFLHGEPDGNYALEVFCSLWDTRDDDVRGITADEALEMIASKRDAPGVRP